MIVVVSVPLRGVRRETTVKSDGEAQGSSVSVPLRGVRRETGQIVAVQAGDIRFLFPSPCGVLGVKPSLLVRDMGADLVSVPLRGVRRETRDGAMWSEIYERFGFRPLAGC